MAVTPMQGGDLRAALSRGWAPDGTRLHWWNGGKGVALDTARGLAFLHANRVMFRDLKSGNILLSREGRAKIGDVGMARILEGTSVLSGGQSALGTFAWAAPELLLGQRCTLTSKSLALSANAALCMMQNNA